ncbi:hypothetical protein BGE01nite_56380 [Brevifollis gellanilyticus]|uniref:Uncharacterized protein n=1 Tax=Brevifollis gellanilyticus TaxID=748831 RepID=A0A512MHX9_9BACT|nr:hypothetical protein BGE01nite_56380 [Brevifollis gellanilyticus]
MSVPSIVTEVVKRERSQGIMGGAFEGPSGVDQCKPKRGEAGWWVVITLLAPLRGAGFE